MSSNPERNVELRPLNLKSTEGAFSPRLEDCITTPQLKSATGHTRGQVISILDDPKVSKRAASSLFHHETKYTRLGSGNATQKEPAFRGWRKSVLAMTCIASVVLFLNLTFGLIATTRLDAKDGLGLIYEGDCKTVSRSDTIIHLFINLLGVILLGASNYTMQCLNSPSRKEVDAAHAQYQSLDIGISSIGNLKHLRPWKVTLWVLLFLSSLPLHLFWNSTVFSTNITNAFDIVVANHHFLEETTFEVPNATCDEASLQDIKLLVSRIQDGYRAKKYTRLKPSQCFHDYTGPTLFDRRNLILMTTPTNGMNATVRYGRETKPCQVPWDGSSVVGIIAYNFPDRAWYDIENTSEDQKGSEIEQQIAENGTWYLGPYEIEDCYSETKDVSHCRLQFAVPLIWVVVACNIVKLICLSLTAYCLWDLNEPIFATIGDAVASFIEHPDPYTQGHCLMDRVALSRGEWRIDPEDRQDKGYNRRPAKRLYSATSALRYWTSMGLCCAYLTVGITLLVVQLITYPGGRKLLDRFGTGNADHQLGLYGGSISGTVKNAIISNSFQLALSTTYFLYNSLYTAQCGATEWSKFTSPKLRTLRLTYPHGQQRSTYYLQLPWRFGIPLASALALMHFLISQSIFLVRLQYYDPSGNLVPGAGYLDVSYSSSATLSSVCVGAVIILAQFINATRKLDNRIPIHGNRSAVISAMCCPPAERHFPDAPDPQASLRPLMWGVTRQPRSIQDPFASTSGYSAHQTNEPGHCSFTNQTVPLPEHGNVYE